MRASLVPNLTITRAMASGSSIDASLVTGLLMSEPLPCGANQSVCSHCIISVLRRPRSSRWRLVIPTSKKILGLLNLTTIEGVPEAGNLALCTALVDGWFGYALTLRTVRLVRTSPFSVLYESKEPTSAFSVVFVGDFSQSKRAAGESCDCKEDCRDSCRPSCGVFTILK